MPRKTARQDMIGDFVEAARQSVIYSEMMGEYVKDAKSKIEKGELDENAFISTIPGDKSIDEVIAHHESQRKVHLHRLNFFKELRKKEYNKIDEKYALKVKDTVPQEIKVNVVDTETKK